MATKPVSRRRRKPAASTKPRAGRAKAPATPASIPAQTAAPEITVPAVYPEADPILADAADRAADLRDQAAADVARILAEGEARAADLLESAGIKAASITETANVEQSRILATAATDADRVRTEAATTAAADADQVRVHAEAKADQLLADARAAADTLTTTAGADADQLRADARHQAREVTTAATVHAEQVRTEAARTAAKTLAEAESARTELLAAAERTAVDTRTRAATDAEQLLEHARGEADRLRGSAVAQAGQVTAGAEKAAAELREDAAREREASRADAARARTLATEDIGRLRATAGEDVDRMTRTARQEAERIVAAARSRVEAELKEAQETLARAKVREADAEVTLQAADDMAKEAGARMARAMDPTERRIERRRRKDGAREERREARAASRAGKPSRAEQAKRFLVVNAERLLVILPITAPMAVAWTGQAGFAEDILGWVAPWTILFAAAFELSTAFVGWMYHQSRKDGDAGTLYRIATWIFAVGAAVMNFWHASGMPKPGGTKVWDEASRRWVEEITYWHFTPKAVAFATMSLVGMALWELYATLLHRRSLRQDGKVAQARPTIGLVRWFRYPRHAFTAWSLAITDASLTTLNRSWYAAERELAFQKTMRSARRGSPLPATYRVLPLTGSPNPGQVPNFFVNLERTDGVNPHDGAANPNRRALPPGPDTNRAGANQQSGKGEPSGGGGSRRTAGEPGPGPEANPAETNGEPAGDGTTNLRTRSQQQREQVQQVLNLFDELGFDNVKLQVVQDRTGMSKTTAYHRLKDARRDWEQRAAG